MPMTQMTCSTLLWGIRGGRYNQDKILGIPLSLDGRSFMLDFKMLEC